MWADVLIDISHQEAHEKMLNIADYQRNTNQNYNDVPHHTSQMAIIKKSANNKCWTGCGKKGTLLYCCVCISVLSHLQLSATPWTIARQAPLSIGFSRQEYWSGLPFPPLGDLPDPGTEPASSALAGGFFTTCATWEAHYTVGGNVNWYNHHGDQYGDSSET